MDSYPHLTVLPGHKAAGKIVFFSALLFAITFNGHAQKGIYITPFGAGQISSIANSTDFYITELKFNYPVRYALGANIIINTSNVFGFETGFAFSKEGQKYTGHINYDANTKDSVSLNFVSECYLNYFQIPLLFRFNSELEEDKVYMNISTGLQFNILSSATMKVDPAPTKGSNDVAFRFNPFTTSFVANAGVNILLTKRLFIYSGLQMARTLGDIENKSFTFDPKTMPFEYIGPVSVKKPGYPSDYTTRYKTRNVVYTLMVGLSIKIQ